MRIKMLLAAAAAVAAGAAWAQQDPVPRFDPYVPKAQRVPSPERGASGEDLRAQAMGKLRARFDEADTNHNGMLTEEEASKGGLGYVARHFADIDTAHRGYVGFDDIKAYLHQRAKEAKERQR